MIRTPRLRRFALTAVGLIVIGMSCARAETFIWAGGQGNWRSISSWFYGGLGVASNFPDSFNDSVQIDLGIPIGSTVTVDDFFNPVRIGSISILTGDTLRIVGGGLYLGGNMSAAGTLRIGDSTDSGYLGITGTTTFSGPGQTIMGHANSQLFGLSSQNTESLTIAADHTLRGIGSINNMHLTNQGRVVAESGGSLGISTSPDGIVNQGVFEIKNGGNLVLVGSLRGGELNSAVGGRLGGGGTLDGVTLTGTVAVIGDQTINVRNTITVSETLRVGNASTSGALGLSGDVTLTGAGQTIMAHAGTQIFGATATGTERLTIGAGHTLRGSSSVFNLKITNLGTIIVDGPDQFTISTNGSDGFLNQGLIDIRSGSRLQVYGVVTGGDIKSVADGRLGGDLSLDGVKTTGVLTLDQSATVGVRNTLTVTDALRVGNAATPAHLVLEANTTLAGAGQTLLDNPSSSISGLSGTGSERLTIASGHTLRGSGMVSKLEIINRGRLQVDSGDVMSFVQSIVTQNGPTAVTLVDGLMTGASFELRGGTLQGRGTVVGLVGQLGGVIAPGDSIGKLVIDGDLVQGAGASLAIEIAGFEPGSQHDWLSVTGEVVLKGKVLVAFSYAPRVGDSFVILTSEHGTMHGTFDEIVATPGILLAPSYSASAVTLNVVAVPEPETAVLMLLGLTLVGWSASRRKRC